MTTARAYPSRLRPAQCPPPAHSEARRKGLKILGHEIYPRLRLLEKLGAVERIQVEGQRPMLWRSRV